MSFSYDAYKTLTVLETKVMVYALKVSLYDYCVSARDISEGCKMDIKTVKGVVGSLCKKGIMDAEKEERGGQVFLDLFPTSPSGEMVSFGDENLEEDDIDFINEWIENNK